MDLFVASLLIQDGIITGTVYSLLAVAIVLVFLVTRVLFLPQGEFISYGALTVVALESGIIPPTLYMVIVLGWLAFITELLNERANLKRAQVLAVFVEAIIAPAVLLALAAWLAPMKLGLLFSVPLTLALVTLLGPYIYRIAFQRLADASILTLLIAGVGVHLALTGLGLFFFGASGARAPAFSDERIDILGLIVTAQSLWILVLAALTTAGLYLIFTRTLYGKMMVATAVNRLGAKLVGIPVHRSGRWAFGAAAFIGAFSGILVGSTMTIYYDTGFIIGLKGFTAAIIAGLTSYPLAMLAAVLIGVLESFSSFLASEYKEIIVFSSMIPFLLWKSIGSKDIGDE